MVGEENLPNTKFKLATGLFEQIVLTEEFVEFLTIPAYQYL